MIFRCSDRYPLTHLFGCLVCESEGSNTVRTDACDSNEICDSMRDDSCLAGTWTCDDKQRSVNVFDGFTRLLVESFEEGIGTDVGHDLEIIALQHLVVSGDEDRVGFCDNALLLLKSPT